MITSHHLKLKKKILLCYCTPFHPPCGKVPGFQSQHPCEHEQMVGRRIGGSVCDLAPVVGRSKGGWKYISSPLDSLKGGFCLSGLRRRWWWWRWFPFTLITCIFFAQPFLSIAFMRCVCTCDAQFGHHKGMGMALLSGWMSCTVFNNSNMYYSITHVAATTRRVLGLLHHQTKLGNANTTNKQSVRWMPTSILPRFV